MNQAEILSRAFKKAVERGWVDLDHGLTDSNAEWGMPYNDGYIYFARDEYFSIKDVIFNHDFAKALWGDGLIHYLNGKWRTDSVPSKLSSRTPFVYEMWEYHLMKMVIADDPIEYLSENI